MTPDSQAVSMPYGDETLEADLRGARVLGAIDVSDVPALDGGADAIGEALRNPIGLAQSIFETVNAGESVAIVVSDSFRQTRIDEVLPHLLGGLSAAGIRDEDLLIVFSTGTHRGPTAEEQRAILGPEVYERLEDRLLTHDAFDESNLVNVGTTHRGTPVEVNKRVLDCDRLIVTGGVVLHYFGGFGGGRKAVVPGLASARTIAHNHAMNLHPHDDTLDPNVRIGAMKGNPVAEDMLEATRFVRTDYLINTVLNRQGAIARIFCGDLEKAHEAACAFARELYAVTIDARADLVVAASPHTKNFVQTHKALFNAYQALAPGGRIVLLAPCPEGLGGAQFTQWLEIGSRENIIAALRQRSEINGQTALSTREKAPATIMVTELSEDHVQLLGARKARTLQGAIDRALGDLREAGTAEPTVYLIPSAAYSVPFME